MRWIKDKKIPVILAGAVAGGGLVVALLVTIGQQFFGKQFTDFHADPYARLENIVTEKESNPQTPERVSEILGEEYGERFLGDASGKKDKKSATGSFVNKNIQLPQNPTEEQKAAYIQQVQETAISTSSIVIAGCMPEPVVVKTNQGSGLQFINRGTEDHAVLIENEHIDLLAGTLTEIEVRFGSGIGIYNYDCDSYFSVGTIWVVE